MKITPYGKAVRRLRLEKEITMSRMAEGLNLSPAFLSGVETGSKKIPADLPEKTADFLKATPAERNSLREAAALSAQEFRVGVSRGASVHDREIAAMFARRFPNLNDDEKASIRRILEVRE